MAVGVRTGRADPDRAAGRRPAAVKAWLAIAAAALLAPVAGPAVAQDVASIASLGGPLNEGPVVLAGNLVYVLRPQGAVTAIDRFEPDRGLVSTLPFVVQGNLSGASAVWTGTSIVTFGGSGTDGRAIFRIDVGGQTVVRMASAIPGPDAKAVHTPAGILLVAAQGCGGPCKSALYNLANDTMTLLAGSAPTAPGGSDATPDLGGLAFYVATTLTGDGTALWGIDTADGDVSIVSGLPVDLVRPAVALAGCHVAVLGGEEGNLPSPAIYLVSPSEGPSRAPVDLPDTAVDVAAVTHRGEVFLFGTGAQGTGILHVSLNNSCPIQPGLPGSPPSGNPSTMDGDRDGVQDAADNCPAVPNYNQRDSDDDRRGDLCDDTPCPPTEEDAAPSLPCPEEDGGGPGSGGPGGSDGSDGADGADQGSADAGARDIDRDGVADTADNCPVVQNRGQENLDDDLQGDLCDLDVDGDGIANLFPNDPDAITDNCPYVPNGDQLDTDLDGPGDACDPPAPWKAPDPATPAGLQGQAIEQSKAWPLMVVAGLVAAGLGYSLLPRKWRLAPLLLFSRLRDEDLLKHHVRAAVVEVVRASPGIHYQGLVRQLNVSRGVLEHHLSILQKANLVREHRWQGTIGYFPVPAPPPAQMRSLMLGRTPLARTMRELIGQRPGITVAEVASTLGVNYAAASYHVKRFQEAGLLRAHEVAGKSMLYMDTGLAPVEA